MVEQQHEERGESSAALDAMAAGRADEAVRICLATIAAGGPETWPYELLGQLLPRPGETAAAIATLEEAAAGRAPTALLLHTLGTLYYRTGAFGKAITTLHRASRLDPARGDTHYLKGLAEFHAGRTRDAIDSLGRAIKLDPSNIIAHYQLAVAHSRAGNLRRAIPCLKAVVATGAEDAAAHYRLGLAYYALANMADAAYHFARSTEIDPHDDASRRMLTMLGESGRPARPGQPLGRVLAALRWLRKSIVARVTILTTAVFAACGVGLGAWLVGAAERGDLDVVRALGVGAATTQAVALVVAGVVWLLVRRPLAALEAAAGRVAGGELYVEVAAERQDEIGRLVAAFNRMTRELRRGQHDLDLIQHAMEQRIEEATDEHRAALEQLQAANARLLEFDRHKSAYVQKVVHDLRAPLSAIAITLENVNDGLLGPLGEPLREALAAAARRAESMERLIADLLDIERLRVGAARPTRITVQLGAIFGRAIDAVRARAGQKRVTLEVTGLEGLPPIIGDPATLESVATNLLDNAVKYTQRDGLVRVVARAAAGSVEVVVTDTGIGIPAGELPLLFEEFFRASNARALEREGTGLGLAIVKRIVTAHGGTIEVESQEGVGTTTMLRLPEAGSGPSGSSPAPADASPREQRQ
jgi:signal transduction histidine kinase